MIASNKIACVIFAAGLLGVVTGCKEEASWRGRSYTERTLASPVGEIKVPTELWERVITPAKPLHDAFENVAATPMPVEHDSAIVKTSVETDLKPITVYMIEETRGVLGGRNLKIVFGPGGGEIDLRDFVVEKRGAFRIVFEFGADAVADEADPNVIKRVWYLSNAQRRKVGPDWVGAGCDTYMDISSFVKKETAKDGILIAIGGDRHVSALAGTFLFSAKRGSRVEVSRLTFTDSTKSKDVLCRGRRES